MDTEVIDRKRIERRIRILRFGAECPTTVDALAEQDSLGNLNGRMRWACDVASLEALLAWADDAKEELYELKALVEQRGWHKGQAEQLTALIARWPRKGE